MKNIKKQKEELIKEFNKPENQLPIKIFVGFLFIDLIAALLVFGIIIFRLLTK